MEEQYRFSLTKEDGTYYKIDKEKFEFIISVQFVSRQLAFNESDENWNYDLLLACKAVGANNVIIINTLEFDKVDFGWQFSYVNNDIKKMKVKISEDFSLSILVNCHENYMLTRTKVDQCIEKEDNTELKSQRSKNSKNGGN